MTPEELEDARRHASRMSTKELGELYLRGPSELSPDAWAIVEEEVQRRERAMRVEQLGSHGRFSQPSSPMSQTDVEKKSSALGVALKLLLGLAGLLLLLVLIGIVLNIPEGVARLPECDSSTAESEVARAMEGAPMGKVLGLKLIKITDIKEVSANDKERRCRGTAQLTNAHKYPISYKFYVDAENDVMVEAYVKGL